MHVCYLVLYGFPEAVQQWLELSYQDVDPSLQLRQAVTDVVHQQLDNTQVTMVIDYNTTLKFINSETFSPLSKVWCFDNYFTKILKS